MAPASPGRFATRLVQQTLLRARQGKVILSGRNSHPSDPRRWRRRILEFKNMRNIHGVPVLDTLRELVDPRHAAVVVVDMQNDFCHPEGHFPRNGKDVSAITASVAPVVEFVRAAQARGVMVAFIRQLTLPNGLSDSPAWLRFKCRDGKSPEYTLQGSWGAELVDGLKPGARDVVVEKFRPDAFVRTPLDGILRARGIQTLVVVGNATEGCVESTIRGGSYHDYYIVAVMDLISSTNAELHQGSQRLVRARYPHADAKDVTAAWDEAAVDHAGEDASRAGA